MNIRIDVLSVIMMMQCATLLIRPARSFLQRSAIFSHSTRLLNQQQSINDSDDSLKNISGYSSPVINWYPGHIAKAEKMLAETLKAVDVVLEVRDSRIPKATAHPMVETWVAGKPRILICTKSDLITNAAKNSWKAAYDRYGAGAGKKNEIEAQVRNQAIQVIRERQKYGSSGTVLRGSDTIEGSKANKKQQSKKNSRRKKTDEEEIISKVEDVLFINAKHGEGIHALNRAIVKAGSYVHERRARRGLAQRQLRVGIIGYPNVGKSALINKILGRRRARSANTPGVTRTLQWIKVTTNELNVSDKTKTKTNSFELLDSPGIIPAHMIDQSDAMLLAMCNSIGEASYDNQAVAAYLMEWIKTLHLMNKDRLCAPQWRSKVKLRYGFDPMIPLKDQPSLSKVYMEEQREYNEDSADDGNRLLTGEDMLFLVADNTCQGDPENASRKILQDFRNGRMGPISLQLAPLDEKDEGEQAVPLNPDSLRTIANSGEQMRREMMLERQKEEEEEAAHRASLAKEIAKEQGLTLPPKQQDSEEKNDLDSVGRGMFEGW